MTVIFSSAEGLKAGFLMDGRKRFLCRSFPPLDCAVAIESIHRQVEGQEKQAPCKLEVIFKDMS